MNVAIIGATGKSGHYLTQEAMQQGYTVTAIVRDAQKLPTQPYGLWNEIFSPSRRMM